MICPSFPQSFRDAWGGAVLPSSYVSIDTETTGLNVGKDYPYELGYALVQDGRMTKAGSAILNLFKFVDEGWLREKWRMSAEQMEKRGIHKRNVEAIIVDACPYKTLGEFADFLEQAVAQRYFIAGHNILRYDLPLLRAVIGRQLNRRLQVPDSAVIDTLAIEQANQAMRKRNVSPQPGETFATWQLRVLSTCREKAALSKECAERYGLFQPGESVKSHTAKYDAILVNRLIEAYRRLSETAADSSSPLQLPFEKETPWRRENGSGRSAPSTTPISYRRQRRI